MPHVLVHDRFKELDYFNRWKHKCTSLVYGRNPPPSSCYITQTRTLNIIRLEIISYMRELVIVHIETWATKVNKALGMIYCGSIF